MKKILINSLPNFIGGLLVVAVVGAVSTIYASVGVQPFIWAGLVLIWLAYIGVWLYTRKPQDEVEVINETRKKGDSTMEYYSCFISYSHKDEAFAKKLHADLQREGVECWFAPEDLKIGDKIRSSIDESVLAHHKLLLILSEYSISSDWVEQEVETAMEKEREYNEPVLFPIRLDEAVMEIKTGWATHIRRTRHIGYFK